MRQPLACLVVSAAACFATPAWGFGCADWWEWLQSSCRRLADTYNNGSNELLVSGYSWHTPWTWTAEKRAEENEFAYGLGWARAVDRANGDADTVFFLVFADSHENAQFNLGYAWTTYWGDREKLQVGLGYTAMIIQRPDIASGVPVPVVLPLATLRHQKVEVLTTYIPNFGGGINNGSVFYVFGRIGLE